jgi:hypothetical protein
MGRAVKRLENVFIADLVVPGLNGTVADENIKARLGFCGIPIMVGNSIHSSPRLSYFLAAHLAYISSFLSMPPSLFHSSTRQ